MKKQCLFSTAAATSLLAGMGFLSEVSAQQPVVPEVVPEVVQVVAQEAATSDNPVTMAYTNENILLVLKDLSEQRPQTSILISPEVRGNVTINLKNVPWLQALNLVLRQHNLDLERVSDDIFQVSKKVQVDAKLPEEIEVELYQPDDFRSLPEAELKKIYGRIPGALDNVTVQQMRDLLATGEYRFVKKVMAEQKSAIKVIQALASKANLNFSFSGINLEEPVQPDANQQQQQTLQQQSMIENKVSLNVRNLPLERVLFMIASRGGFSCSYRDDVWEISPRRPDALQPLVLGQYSVNFLPIDKQLLTVLRSVVSARSKITEGKNKMIVVMATEDEQEAIRSCLAVMDKPTPQVMIEARFFDLNEDESKYIGIDWSAALGSTGTSLGLSYTNAWSRDTTDEHKDFDVQTAVLTLAGFNATLHALKEDIGSTQLANPKIIVTSGQQATIHIGQKEPIFKATSSGSGESAQRTYELDDNFGKDSSKIANLTGNEDQVQDVFNTQGTPGYLDLGTLLTVAPTVKTEDQVYIKVIPNLTTRIGERTAGDGTIYPLLYSTKVFTEFTLGSGSTVAIGGLTKEDKGVTNSKVPVLGDIPLLGKYLFSYEENSVKRSETVIFLTVKVLPAKDLKITSGIPVGSRAVDKVLDQILIDDTNGAEYIRPVKKAPAVKTTEVTKAVVQEVAPVAVQEEVIVIQEVVPVVVEEVAPVAVEEVAPVAVEEVAPVAVEEVAPVEVEEVVPVAVEEVVPVEVQEAAPVVKEKAPANEKNVQAIAIDGENIIAPVPAPGIIGGKL